MATNKTKAAETTENTEETKVTEAEEARVEVFVPKGHAGEEPNMFVSVNGVNYLLPRGKKSMVPPHIKAEIDRAAAAEAAMDEHIEQMLNASK